jgi:hypothetical protein
MDPIVPTDHSSAGNEQPIRGAEAIAEFTFGDRLAKRKVSVYPRRHAIRSSGLVALYACGPAPIAAGSSNRRREP